MEKVKILGPRGSFENVAILGPFREKTQVEISLSDSRFLGLAPPIRSSNDLEGSAGCTIAGPAGKIELETGVIVPKRHIHLSTDDAKNLNLKDKDTVMVEIKTEQRSLIFGDVVIKVRHDYIFSMHIDTDEANAAGCIGNIYGKIIVK